MLSMSPEDRYAELMKMSPIEREVFSRRLDPADRDSMFNDMSPKQRETIMAMNRPEAVVTNELMQSKILRATYSDRQLEEVMTDFWFNHFNVFINKGRRSLPDHVLRARRHPPARFWKIQRSSARHRQEPGHALLSR